MTQITKEQILNASAEELKGLAGVGENKDCSFCTSCDSCYNCYDCNSCNYCKYCTYCNYCDSCKSCTSCKYCNSCNDCYKSQNQKGKQFVFCNVQLSKNEYFDAISKVR